MKSLNRIQLIGNLGGDPIMAYTESGHPITSFSMAVNTEYKTSTEEVKKRTEWFTIKLMFNSAESAHQLLNKGDLVRVEGELQTNTYKNTTRNEVWVKDVWKIVRIPNLPVIEDFAVEEDHAEKSE